MIIFGLEGVLADCDHRMHFIDSNKAFARKLDDTNKFYINDDIDGYPIITEWKPDYKFFYQACGQDKPILETIRILNCIQCGYSPYHDIHIWSDRCESIKPKTNTWLLMNVTTDLDIIKNLKLRPINDTRPAHIVKEKWLDSVVRENRTVDFVIESDPETIEMFRRRGIFVFDVNQGK